MAAPQLQPRPATVVKCGNVSCDGSACYVALWPGQTTLFCKQCAARAQVIALVLGFALEVEPIITAQTA